MHWHPVLTTFPFFFKGVALSVTTLILALAQSFPVEYSGCYEKAVNRLKRVRREKERKKIPVWIKKVGY